MKKVLAAAVGATLILAAGVAAAAEVKGVIAKMNIETRDVTIDTTTVRFPQTVSLNGIIVGLSVLITYTTADNVNTASAVSKVVK